VTGPPPRIQRVAAYNVCHDDASRLLMCRLSDITERPGWWTLPGGGINFGEHPEAGALRELEEETGLRCTLGPLVEVLDRVVRGHDGAIEYHFVILDFLGTAPTGTLAAGSDSSDARFVAVSELGSYDVTDGLAPVVARALVLRDTKPLGPVRATEK